MYMWRRAAPALTELNVGHTDLGDVGFGALAEALGHGACPGMADLTAYGNGLTMLPEALCGVASLEQLILSTNDIGSLPHGLLHLAWLRLLHIRGHRRLAATAASQMVGRVGDGAHIVTC
eukprot:COSAG04_NODE_3026_length_3264_cov_16.178515_3_plen_120_part_00